MRICPSSARTSAVLVATSVAALLLALPARGRDDRILWSEAGIESGGGGWWYPAYITERIAGYEASGIPASILQEAMRGVPRLKQATVTEEGMRHYWYWYCFRFSRSKVKGVYIHGPGSVRLTFTDPEDPANTFVTPDEGMLVSCDEAMDCYRDTANGSVVVKPYPDDKKRQILVCCLIRLPQEVDGRQLDRITVLAKVEPIDGGWEVMK